MIVYYNKPKQIKLLENKLYLLKESITDTTYHYCGVKSCCGILSNGKIGLTMSTNGSDAYHNTSLFYLSTQRSKSMKFGYAYHLSRNGESWTTARIELDGYELKKDGYQGKPIDYWGENLGKQSDIGPTASRRTSQTNKYSSEELLKIQQNNINFEIEDRIFSNKPFISNLNRYIKRIDILVNQKDMQSMPFVKKILELSQNYNFKVFAYDNPNDFEKQNNNFVNNYILSPDVEMQYNDFENESESDSTNAEILSELAIVYIYPKCDSYIFDEEKKDKVKKLLDKFKLSNYYEDVLKQIQKQFINLVNISSSLGHGYLRTLNTNCYKKSKHAENIMLLAQFVLNSYNKNNFVDLAKMFAHNKNTIEEIKPLQKSVKCLILSYDKENIDTIIDGETELFWENINPTNFIYDIRRMVEDGNYYRENNYDDSSLDFKPFKHKSKNDEHFFKYIQHLRYNDNLSLYEGMKILCNLFGNNKENIIKNMMYLFYCVYLPIEITKDNFKDYEKYMRFSDREKIINKLYGNITSYYAQQYN